MSYPTNRDRSDSYGWEHHLVTECDRCHMRRACCSVDFNDGSGEWDYCRECWHTLAKRGVFKREGLWS